MTVVSHRGLRLLKIKRACRCEVIGEVAAELMVLSLECTLFVRVFRMCQGKRANVRVSKGMRSPH